MGSQFYPEAAQVTPVQIPDLLRIRPSFFFSPTNVLVLERKARTSVKIEFEKNSQCLSGCLFIYCKLN